MKKEALKELGLDEKTIKAVMQLHGQLLNDEIAALRAADTETEAWKSRAEAAENALADEKTAHQSTITGHKTEKENTAKAEALKKAIIDYRHVEKGKLNPRQADLLITAFGDKVEYTKNRDGDKPVFSVKNMHEIMGEAVSHGGFEFARSETKSAVFGSFQNVTTPNEKPNLTAALLGGGETPD